MLNFLYQLVSTPLLVVLFIVLVSSLLTIKITNKIWRGFIISEGYGFWRIINKKGKTEIRYLSMGWLKAQASVLEGNILYPTNNPNDKEQEIAYSKQLIKELNNYINTGKNYGE